MSLLEIRNRFEKQAITKPQYIDDMYACHRILFEYAELIRNSDIQKIEITRGQVIMTATPAGSKHPIRILCDPLEKRTAPIDILNFHRYEPEESSILLSLIKDHFTILDIGANIGWYTIAMAQQLKSGRVIALEPIPSTFKKLKSNIHLNKVDRITLHNLGFSDRETDLKFYYPPSQSGAASAVNLLEDSQAQEIICKVVRLDDFVKQHSLEVSLMKCDVEGAELMVFRGGAETIRSQNPILFVEMLRKWSRKFGYHPNDMIDLLTGMGYGCYVARSHRLVPVAAVDDETVETNFFFLHDRQHEDLVSRWVQD